MSISNLWGFYFNPRQQWLNLQQKHSSLVESLSHLGFFSAIAPCCLALSMWFFGIEWAEKTRFIQPLQILGIATCMYLSIVTAVLLLAFLARAMTHDYGRPASFDLALELACYTVTPLLCTGFAWLFPEGWFLLLVGLLGLIYSIYLLFLGTSILLEIPDERGFMFSTTLVTAGLVLLALLFFANAFIWMWVLR